MAKERIIFEVDFNLGDARKNVIAYEKTLLELKQTQKDLDASFKTGELSTHGYASATFDLKAKITETKNAQKEYQRQIDLTTRANVANAGSYEQITAELALENAALKNLAQTLIIQEDGTFKINEAYDEQFQKVRKLKDAQLAFDKVIREGRTNVGNYQQSVEDALKSANLFGISIGKAGETVGTTFSGGLGVAKGALNGLYKAVLANPVTAILAGIAVALKTVVTAFTSTERGANKVAQVMARFKPIVDLVYSSLASVGEVVFTVVEGFSKFVAFVGGFSKTAEESEKLTENLQNVEKQLIKINSQDKQSRAEAEKIKSLRDDESRSFKDRIADNTKLGQIENERFKRTIDAENKKLSILEAQLKRIPENLRTTEQLKEVEEQRAKIAETTEDFYGRITEQITNQVSLLRDQLTAQADISDALFEQKLLNGKIAEGSTEELSIRKKSAENRLDIELKQFDKLNKLEGLSRAERLKKLAETDEKAKLLIVQSENSILELDKGFREKQAEQYEEYLDKINEQRKAYLDDQIAGFELEVEKTQEGTQARLEAEKALLASQSQARVETEKLTGNALSLERERLKTALSEKEKEINTLSLNETQARLEREAQLDAENTTKKIALLQFQSNRRITEEKLTGEALKTEVALTEKAISDIRKAETEKQKLDSATKIKAEIDNNASKVAVLIDAQKLAIEQDTVNEFEKNERLLALKKKYLEDLRIAEQATAQAQFEFDLEFTANTEAEKEALKIAYTQQSLDIERNYANESKAITKSLNEADLGRLENAQAVFGGLASLFNEQSTAYKLFASSEALISTYLAANKALASAPPPFGAILAGITTAKGLINVAKINGAKFERGGIFGGKPHSSGGTKGYFDDGTTIEVEKGEAFAVVNKKNTPMLKTLSAVNSFGGNGKSFFERGGFVGNEVLNIGQTFLNANTANELIIKSIPPVYLRITDLYEAENRANITDRISNQ
jgi:hypothetical protein